MKTNGLNVIFVNHTNLSLNKRKVKCKIMSKERSVFSNDLHKSTLAARAYFILRSSAKVFCTKNVLKNFAYSTGKHLRWNLLLFKVALQVLQVLQLY